MRSKIQRALPLTSLFLFSTMIVSAQQTDPKAQLEAAKTFSRQGDFANAIVVLNKALQKDPNNLEMNKELAFDYFLQHGYTRGLVTAKPLVERTDADVLCSQILGMR